MATKKDYERAANIIREGRYTEHSRPILIEAFTTFFAADDSAFAYERFKEACQPRPTKRITKRSVCADCGEPGKITGHQECQYPQNHE